MSDQPAPTSPTSPEPKPKFPERTFPVVYADGLWSFTSYPGMVKFYLFRNDPSFPGDLTSNIMPFIQCVMPTGGFLGMAVFFEKQLQILMQRGEIKQSEIDGWRKIFESKPDAKK